MTAQSRLGHMRNTRFLAGAAVSLTAAILVGTAGTSSAAPCDIYASGGTPCVAAHSTTRALFDAYNGPLYQVRRSGDKAVQDNRAFGAGGTRNAAAPDSFCAGTRCLFSIISDPTGRRNHPIPVAPL